MAKTNKKPTKPKKVSEVLSTKTPSPTPTLTPIQTPVYTFSKTFVHLSLVALVLVLIVSAYFAKGLVLAATVNGKPILRWTLIKQLEAQGGQQALDRMVTEQLIIQSALKKGLTVPAEDIQKEIETIEQRFAGEATLDQLLATEGLTKTQLEDQIRVNKYLDQLLGSSKEISQDEVDAFIKDNQAMLPKDTSKEELETIARDQLVSQNKQKQVQDLLANLRAEASINYFIKL